MRHKIRFLGLFLACSFGLSGGLRGIRLARAGVGEDVAAGVAAAGCAAAASGVFTASVSVDPHHLNFQAAAGEPPSDPQPIAVQCVDVLSGEGCGASISTDQPWLQTDHDGFFGGGVVGVRVDPSALDAGVYEGKIHVKYDLISIDDSEDISVELTVDTPPNPPSAPPAKPDRSTS